MLLVVEGLDGSGKSTQVELVRKYLAQTRKVHYIHFPRYDSPVYGDLIGRFLRGGFGSIDSVHPNLVALLFAEDRHGAAPEIRDALEKGETVLLDRYVNSNIAYQCAKLADPAERVALRDWIRRTEYGEFGIPRPDLNIFLDVPVDFVRSRLTPDRVGGDRGYLEGSVDIHEADIDFQSRVRDIYLEQCSLDPSIVRVDCSDVDGRMLSPDRIFSKLKELIG